MQSIEAPMPENSQFRAVLCRTLLLFSLAAAFVLAALVRGDVDGSTVAMAPMSSDVGAVSDLDGDDDDADGERQRPALTERNLATWPANPVRHLPVVHRAVGGHEVAPDGAEAGPTPTSRGPPRQTGSGPSPA